MDKCRSCGKQPLELPVYSGSNISLIKSVTNNHDTIIDEGYIPIPINDKENNSVAFFAKDYKIHTQKPKRGLERVYIIQKITIETLVKPYMSYLYKTLEYTKMIPKEYSYYELIVLDKYEDGGFSTRINHNTTDFVIGSHPTGEDVFTFNHYRVGLILKIQKGENYIVPNEYVEEVEENKRYRVTGWEQMFLFDGKSPAGLYPHTRSEPDTSIVKLVDPAIHSVSIHTKNGEVTERMVLPANSVGSVKDKRKKDFYMIKTGMNDEQNREVLNDSYGEEIMQKIYKTIEEQTFIEV
jgi:hypothetical protein